MAILDPNEIFFTAFEPKQANRFILYMDGVPRPKVIQQGTVTAIQGTGYTVKTADAAGDGTTTATLLAQEMVNAGLKYLNNGANAVEIKRGIDTAVKEVVASLRLSPGAWSINTTLTSLSL